MAERVRGLSLQIYAAGRDHAAQHGIIVADTKFEFGVVDEKLLLIDECLTPDSSRFWPKDQYVSGKVRPVLINNSSAIIWRLLIGTKRRPRLRCRGCDCKDSAKYVEAFERLTGEKLR